MGEKVEKKPTIDGELLGSHENACQCTPYRNWLSNSFALSPEEKSYVWCCSSDKEHIYIYSRWSNVSQNKFCLTTINLLVNRNIDVTRRCLKLNVSSLILFRFKFEWLVLWSHEFLIPRFSYRQKENTKPCMKAVRYLNHISVYIKVYLKVKPLKYQLHGY